MLQRRGPVQHGGEDADGHCSSGDSRKSIVQIAATAEVGGMVARVGQRLLEGVARTMMDRFYACLPKQVDQGGGS